MVLVVGEGVGCWKTVVGRVVHKRRRFRRRSRSVPGGHAHQTAKRTHVHCILFNCCTTTPCRVQFFLFSFTPDCGVLFLLFLCIGKKMIQSSILDLFQNKVALDEGREVQVRLLFRSHRRCCCCGLGHLLFPCAIFSSGVYDFGVLRNL